MPDLAFFSKEEAAQFVKGKRYQRLKLDMKKGMRTCVAPSSVAVAGVVAVVPTAISHACAPTPLCA
eukprot:1020886-Prymnesium_polylepis.1